MLPLNTGFNEQFLGDALIDWSNRLTTGLILSAYNSVRDAERPPINYVNGAVGTKAVVTKGAPAISACTPGGWLSGGSVSGSGSGSGSRTKIHGSASFNGSTSWAHMALDLQPSRQTTVAFWYKRTSTSDAISIEYGANWTTNGFIVDPQSGGAMLVANAATGNNAFQTLAAQITVNEWHHHVVGFDRSITGNQIVAWNIDGTPVSATPSGVVGSPADWATNAGLNLGARNSGASAPASMEICGLQIWNRLLRSDERVAVYREGWRMFKPVRRPPFPLISVASAATIQSWFLVQ